MRGYIEDIEGIERPDRLAVMQLPQLLLAAIELVQHAQLQRPHFVTQHV